MAISGNNFQGGQVWGDASYFFSRRPHTWGWATWRRAWSLCDLEMRCIGDLREQTPLDWLFADTNVALSWKLALAHSRFGVVNTWDYEWFCSCLLNHGLCATPNTNLVENIGQGPAATHTAGVVERLSRVGCDGLVSYSPVVHPQSVFLFRESRRIRIRAARFVSVEATDELDVPLSPHA